MYANILFTNKALCNNSIVRNLRTLAKLEKKHSKNDHLNINQISNKFIFERKLKKLLNESVHKVNEVNNGCLSEYKNFCNRLFFKSSKSKIFSSQFFVLEGQKLINEAIASQNVHLDYIFYCATNKKTHSDDKFNFIKSNANQNAKWIEINQMQMSFISDVKTSAGILAQGRMKNDERVNMRADESSTRGIHVLLNDVKDAGNMGTIVRTASALGCSRIWLTSECVNPWTPKVMRAAMGAHFRFFNQQLSNISLSELKQYLSRSKHLLVVISDANPKSGHKSIRLDDLRKEIKKIKNLGKQRDILLVIGSESFGISQSIYELVYAATKSNATLRTLTVRIELQNSIESLNCSIAFAIICFQLKQLFTFS